MVRDVYDLKTAIDCEGGGGREGGARCTIKRTEEMLIV
jgi:hypothetical protein